MHDRIVPIMWSMLHLGFCVYLSWMFRMAVTAGLDAPIQDPLKKIVEPLSYLRSMGEWHGLLPSSSPEEFLSPSPCDVVVSLCDFCTAFCDFALWTVAWAELNWWWCTTWTWCKNPAVEAGPRTPISCMLNFAVQTGPKMWTNCIPLCACVQLKLYFNPFFSQIYFQFFARGLRRPIRLRMFFGARSFKSRNFLVTVIRCALTRSKLARTFLATPIFRSVWFGLFAWFNWRVFDEFSWGKNHEISREVVSFVLCQHSWKRKWMKKNVIIIHFHSPCWVVSTYITLV